MQMADNAGASDADRAVNYCAFRYPAIYGGAAGSFAANSSPTGLEVRPSPPSGAHKIVEVIFSLHDSLDRRDRKVLRAGRRYGGVSVLHTKLSPYFHW
jgi:PatG C-terminal